MKVIIAGAGLVGAATALALCQIGIECTMYDQVNFADAIKKAKGGTIEAIDFGESGGSVLLGSSALQVLKSLGVLEEVMANSLKAPYTHWFKIDGSCPIRLDSVAVTMHAGETDPAVQCPVQILRAKVRTREISDSHPNLKPTVLFSLQLHDILVKASYKAGARTFSGKKLVSVTEANSNVTVTFADGTTATGDLVIGADGIHSATRRSVFGKDLKAKFTGQVGYIGIVNISEHKIELNEFCAFYIDREKKRMVSTFKFSEQVAVVRVSTFNDPDPEEVQDDEYRPYPDLPKHSERLADLIEGWGVPDNLVMMMRKAHRIIPASIYDLPDLTTYHHGRVLLAGDSAHGMLPNAGIGLAVGLEDVGTLVELFKQLPNPSDLPTVLALYSQLRVPRATAGAKRSRDMAVQYYSVSALGVGVSHFLLRFGVFLFNNNWIKYGQVIDCGTEVANAISKEIEQ
ncbi:hypothetical protein HDU98_000036 [Podochytrium sp. JEL0797]|nr:hypothetical protein HDU98_000036 [Podochytrium sp. JEL0797]